MAATRPREPPFSEAREKAGNVPSPGPASSVGLPNLSQPHTGPPPAAPKAGRAGRVMKAVL